MSSVIYLEDPREAALKIVYGGKAYSQIQRQARYMKYDYFKMLDYGETLFRMGILCINSSGQPNLYANQNGKFIKKRELKERQP